MTKCNWSGLWARTQVNGRSGQEGAMETVIYTDSIPRKDIIHTHIQFTLAMRLSPDLAGILKSKY